MRRRGDSSAGQPASRSRDLGARDGVGRRGRAENGSAGNGTASNGTAGNSTAGNSTTGDGTAGNSTAGRGTAGNNAAGRGTSGRGTSGHGTLGHGTPVHGATGHRAARSGRFGKDGASRGAQAGTGQDSEQSVFVPGYRSRRPSRESGHQAAGPGTASAGWPDSPADAAVGKGPIRGFPPAPGQPPPLYPPGQFAAWNRMSATADDPRTGTLPGTLPGTGPWAGSGADGQPGQSWYGENEPGSQAYEPGYSALAVSDPAADVTSTQTWQAIGDGPDGPGGAGTWTDPHGTAVQAPPAGESWGAGQGAGADSPALASPATRTPATRTPATEPPVTGSQDPGTGTGAARTGATGTRAVGSRTAARAAGSRAAGSRSGRSARKGSSSRKGRRSPGPVLAVCAVLVLALAAGTFLLLTYRHPRTVTTGRSASTATTPTPTPSPTLGPFGHIASRAADPLPLTITQLFPRTFVAGGVSYLRTISQVSKSCTTAVIGTTLQSAVQAAKCSQVVRASYLSTIEKEMGTIGVLNLGSATAAEHAGRSAGASDFIAQLRARKGATHELGMGTGIEEAAAKGHYLILIWAQFTSRAKPKTAAERAKLEAFMNDLFQQTANLSLSSRMVDGTP
jgi:hypothetical protein